MSEISLKYEPREDQLKMLEFTKSSIESGNRYIMINSPTGSGKSFFAIMLSKWYKEKFGSDKKITMLTGSKLLQEQYVKDFPFINNLKGQSNYWCKDHRTDCKTGKELNALVKRHCEYCPYDVARWKWMAGDISLTNFHLFNTFSLYVPDNIEKRNTSLLIIDEAHDFEGVFTSFISTKLSLRLLKLCGFDMSYIKKSSKIFKRIREIGQVVDYIKETFLEDLENSRQHFDDMLGESTNNAEKKIYINYIDRINEQYQKFTDFLKYYEEDENNWSLDIVNNFKNGNIELIMQPIWSHEYMKKLIWPFYDHIVFLSATILDKKLFSYINGLDIESSVYTEIDSSFPVENRLIYYIKGIGKMTYNEKTHTFKNQINVINKILKKYEKDKGIIHTNSYELNSWVIDGVKNDRFIYHESENREEQYNKFLDGKEPNVMVSPSMMTGIDLKSDSSRFGVLLKVPYPSLASNNIKLRQASNKQWYLYYTATQLVQAFGRIVRSDTDYGYNYILDDSFSNILKDGYIPKYILDSIKLVKSK